jgi:hypothetical protein
MRIGDTVYFVGEGCVREARVINSDGKCVSDRAEVG